MYFCCMSDVHDKETRSYNMSQVKSKNTKTEMIVRKFLFSKGFRYRIHDNKLPGKPDIVLRKYKTVIFINGCFWHGHENCKYYSVPKTRTEWWLQKISATQTRDQSSKQELKKLGWKTIIVWTCELKNKNKDERLTKLIRKIYYI
jgi:DNA mismatch endonuclease, patch repair protein